MKAKALFLLFIFMFNTVVGFGCSLFMESGGHKHLAGLHHKINVNAPDKNSPSKVIEKEDSCCKTISNNLIVQGKLTPDDLKINLKAPFLIPVLSNYGLIFKEKILAVNPYPIGQHRFQLPHPDIRVSIQSFQL